MTAIDDPTPAYRFRFGAAAFDESRLELRVGGLKVELEQRPLQVLQALLRHPDEVVTKAELLDSVWQGRPTVENVLANAVAKLRKSLGPEGGRIVTVPRVGYRLAGPVERIAAGRRLDSRLALHAGQPVPGRSNFLLERQLSGARGHEVWVARHDKTHERRVYKLSADGETLAMLKREATLYRVVTESLGERDDFVRVLDWNFESPPFFLECAYGGVSLAAWSQQDGRLAAMPLEVRLALFERIANAVAAAHSVGVLHKDIKPANVLVAEEADGSLAVRLTDFGAGRLMEPDRLRELGITQLGMTVTQQGGDSSGTPLYLAPEILAGQGPTIQSDVYSLGMMLYQLVVADFRRPMTPGWEHDVADPLLREDIASATDGNPARRLKSVPELVERLASRERRAAERRARRAEQDRAAAAEHALQLARARRPWLAAAGLILVAGLAASLWFYYRERQTAAQLAEQMKVEAAVNNFITHDLIGAANPAIRGRSDVTVVDAVKAAMPHIDRAFAAASPEVRATLHHALQQSLSGLTDSQDAIAEGRKAIAAYLQTQPRDWRGLCAARIRLARDMIRIGEYDEVAELLDGVQQRLDRLQPADPVLQIELWQARSAFAANQVHEQQALALDRKAWALLQTLPDPDPELRDRVQFYLADSLNLTGHLKEAEQFLRDLVVRQTLTLGPHHQQTLYSTVVLANNLLQQNRYQEAAQLLPDAVDGLRKALGPEHGRTLMAESVLGNVYFYTRQYDRARDLLQSTYQGMAARFGDRYEGSISIHASLAYAIQQAGDPGKAAAMYRQLLATANSALGHDNPLTEFIRYDLADCLIELHQPDQAAALLQGLSLDKLKTAEPTDDWPARLDYQRARLAAARHQHAAALALVQHARQELSHPEVRRADALPEKLQALLGSLAARSS